MSDSTLDAKQQQRVEKLLAEAVRGYLSADKAKLGLASHGDVEENSHTQWFQWENIDDMFGLKAADSPYSDNLTSAFYAVHSYKYLEDPTFGVAMDKELSAHGIPNNWREQALKYIDEIREELKGSDSDWSERDAGWNPAIDEIADMTRNADRRDPKTSKPFTGGGPAPAENELAESITEKKLTSKKKKGLAKEAYVSRDYPTEPWSGTHPALDVGRCADCGEDIGPGEGEIIGDESLCAFCAKIREEEMGHGEASLYTGSEHRPEGPPGHWWDDPTQAGWEQEQEGEEGMPYPTKRWAGRSPHQRPRSAGKGKGGYPDVY